MSAVRDAFGLSRGILRSRRASGPCELAVTPRACRSCVSAGASRNVILASDAMHYYEQLERDWVFSVCDDAEGMRQGYEVLRRLAAESEAVLVAGHDPEVTRRFTILGGSVKDIALEIA